jgi:hypothetical protein
MITQLTMMIVNQLSAVFLHASNRIVGLQGDPGLPGGDPDLPDAPLDGGVYVLVALALIYGYRKLKAMERREAKR